MNKSTVALTTDQYREILVTMKQGFCGFHPNPRTAAALTLEANLGIRISDIVYLRLCDIVQDGGRFRLNIVEQKTGKARRFTVPDGLYNWLRDYCRENGIREDERIFPVTTTSIQKNLRIVCEYLGFEGISTHSFRKYFASEVYKDSGYNLALVTTLLQHASPQTTMRYIGVSTREVEKALQGHLCII